jgi:GT2 family glycosyltransferase
MPDGPRSWAPAGPAPAAAIPVPAGIDVIVPVYRGRAELKRCLDAVLAHEQRVPFALVVVDDCSPEPEVSAYLDALAAADDRVTLLRNDDRLGFAGSVNRALRLHRDRDIVLLNSDTEVAGDWLDRLCRCARGAADTGTVTPFTNNGTICSFPSPCRDNELPAGMTVAQVDAAFAWVNAGSAVELPTAVGFCMYIRRDCLDRVGLLDTEVFGGGYGEENDFCMRARRLGFKHLLCGDSFVFHAGAVSFGPERDARVEAAVAKLNTVYPRYRPMIERYLAADPAGAIRLAARLAVIRRRDAATVLFVNHRLGGGTERHLRELAGYLAERMHVVVLRPDAGRRVALSLGPEPGSGRLLFDLPGQYEDLLSVCAVLGVSRVHVHHIVELPIEAHTIARDLDVPWDVTVHDYYFINANPTLTDAAGRYCADEAERDRRCATAYPIPGGLSAEGWRDRQADLLRGAERVIAPSECAARLIEQAFPGVGVVRARHPDAERDEPWPAPRARAIRPDEPLRVLALGALGPAKGADRLEACARGAADRRLPLRFELIGYAYRPLDRAVEVSGTYRDEDLPALIEQARPHLIWFPAQWPETYNYCLSAALAAGAPIVAPDIGAFPERLAGRPLTWVERWDLDPDGWLERFLQIRRAWSPPGAAAVADGTFGSSSSTFRYRDDYLRGPAPTLPPLEPRQIHALAERLVQHQPALTLSRRERTLLALNTMRDAPLLRTVSRLVPRRLRRAVRQRLSHRTIEDLLLAGR